MIENKGKARIFVVSGETNKDGKHAGFIYRQEFIPMKDGLEFIRESIEKSDCDYFEVRIYDNDQVAKAASDHRKKNRDESLLAQAARYVRTSRLTRLWEKNSALGEKLMARDGKDALKKYLANYIDNGNIDNVAVQKEFNKVLKAAWKERKNA